MSPAWLQVGPCPAATCFCRNTLLNNVGKELLAVVHRSKRCCHMRQGSFWGLRMGSWWPRVLWQHFKELLPHSGSDSLWTEKFWGQLEEQEVWINQNSTRVLALEIKIKDSADTSAESQQLEEHVSEDDAAFGGREADSQEPHLLEKNPTGIKVSNMKIKARKKKINMLQVTRQRGTESNSEVSEQPQTRQPHQASQSCPKEQTKWTLG